MTVAGFPIWQRLIQERIEEALGSYLPSADSPPVRLHQAMRYVTLGGGKRVRPLLCHAARDGQ